MASPNNIEDESQEMQISYLHDLNLNGEENFNIEITVTRRWAETEQDSRVQGINLILVDKYDNRCHCWVPLQLINDEQYRLVEGNDYLISNFSVEPFNQMYRCFEADLHIVLHRKSRVTSLPASCGNFPKDVFQYTTLKMVKEAALQDSYLIDVIGIIEDLKPLEPVDGPGNEKHFYQQFYLTDLIHRVRVRFWDGFALKFQQKYNQNSKNPTIITISSCRVMKNQYNGENTIRNVAATRFFMNFNSTMDINLRKRMWEINGLE